MDNKLTVIIQQPSVPTYRRQLFEKLDNKFRLILYYGFDDVPSDLPDNILKKYFPLRVFRIGRRKVMWHAAQLEAVNKISDVSILSWNVQYLTLWLAVAKGLIINKPFILWGHGYSKKDSRLKQFIRNIPARFADAIILYDFHTAEEIRKLKGFKYKVFVAPNSIDLTQIQKSKEKWQNDPAKLKAFKLENNINESFNLIYIGRIYPENKLELLLDALKRCIDKIVDFKLIIIGKENPYSEILKKKAESLGIASKITWTGEIYDEDRIAPWMISSHLFCYPANIGLSIMHAFGYSLPVVTDDAYSSHNPEIRAFNNGINGLSYKSGDPVDFSEKILRIYFDSKLRSAFRENSYSGINDLYTIDNMVQGFMDAIHFTLK